MKMENNSQLKFLSFVINFYRFLGITFGGVTLDKNGNIIKLKFWYHFGWLGFVIYTISLLYFAISSFDHDVISKIGLTMYLLFNGMWYLTSINL